MGFEIVIATRNRGKAEEIGKILDGAGVTARSLDEFPGYAEPEETGTTFRENAIIKAAAAHAFTGLPALADDSGIEVDALGGEPGILSARYGGPGLSDMERCMKLLEALEGIPEEQRTARFRCVMVLYPEPGGSGGAIATEGILEGRIAFEPDGSAGFGYDPVFFVPQKGMTVARMGPSEKNSISHRYRALVEMKAALAWIPGRRKI